jgi:hypothetical protein
MARRRQQNARDRLIPREVWEADEARRRARRDRGVDSDESTVGNESEASGHVNDTGAPENEETLGETIKEVLRRTTTAMFRRVLMFTDGAATSLYDDQMITTFDILRELDDDTIKETCRAIKKPGGAAIGYQISELSVTRFKLFAFWARHMWRTCRPINDWTDVIWDEVSILKNQKTLEDSLQDQKIPETPAMTLDLQLAAKAFLDMTVLLGKMRGISGIPLAYVMRYNLKSPNNTLYSDPTTDSPAFGRPGSAYSSVDEELIARAAILRNDLTQSQLSASLETLESEGPFEPTFMADMVSVFHILHACWGKSSWWTHVKKVKGKNGRQVWRILHATLLGGDRITATSSAIVTKLQSFKYEGDQKNFNFDKYVTLHVEQHNQHSDLTEYGVKPLDESLKIHWFQDGIKCTTLDAVKAAITTNKEKYSKFDSVKDAYVDFNRTMTPTLDPRTRQIATVGAGRDGGGRSRQTGRGGGQRTGDSRKKGLVPQSEIDKQTHITIRDYSPDEYKRLTPAEKAKLWQLRNPNKTPGTGPTRRDCNSSVASTSTTTTSSTAGKRQAEDSADKDEKPTDDAGWGRNRDNPVLGRQVCSRNENDN